MKVIEYSASAQNVTHLPPEVLHVIATYVKLNRPPRAVQRDLWSCCLVSKAWYNSFIAHLYESPVLSPRNFPEFAQILCPPVTSRNRRVGLEDFVQNLNMGMLAYESKKSTTSRLISRTKNSLRTFAAPAVSFSTTSLAPLSKCSKLERLDLSRDHYDFNFTDLVRATRSLGNLTWLSLPKDVDPFICVSNSMPPKPTETLWPPNLKYLQINDTHLEPSVGMWTRFLQGLPLTLTHLAFWGLTLYDAFDNIAQTETRALQILELTLGVSRSDDTYYFNHICIPFPSLSKITVPAMTSWVLKNFIFTDTGATWTLQSSPINQIQPPQNLEHLVLEESPDFPTSAHIGVADLRQFVDDCPKLTRIDVPEAYINIEEEEDAALDQLNRIVSQRAEQLKDESTRIRVGDAGIFMTDSLPPGGVGMKRSFRYRGQD